MKIDLPIKIHNKFEIEVKDVVTGEIVQKGHAENIVLDAYFTTPYVHSTGTVVTRNDSFVGSVIAFGKGTGELSSSRTTLFTYLDSKEALQHEIVINQAPLSSYATKYIKLLPEEYIGETITEVGVANSLHSSYKHLVYTHALIKDSAGNSLTLGPKTGTQEITIYSTIYFVPDFEPGITLVTSAANHLVSGFVGWNVTGLRVSSSSESWSGINGPRLFINSMNPDFNSSNIPFSQNGMGKLRRYERIDTAQHNEKIKTISVRSRYGAYGFDYPHAQCFDVNLLTLAENNSSIWSGWGFDKTPIGTGDGSTTEFPLPWDEAWLDKPKTIYVDGVATAVTWTEDTITFAAAPADQAPITGSYWVKYVPKDENHVLDITFDINYAGGVTT